MSVREKKRLDVSTLFYLIILILLIYTASLFQEALPVTVSPEKDWQQTLNSIFEKRDNILLNGNVEELADMYVPSERNSGWARELEEKRAQYLKDWAARQGILFKSIRSDVLIKRVKAVGRGYAFYVIISTEYVYVYEDEPDKENTFRIGTYHSLDLIPGASENSWIISREWYLDPFQDSLNQEALNTDEVKEFVLSQSERDFSNISERRKKAVAYADLYAGAASDDPSKYDYNKEYPNYNNRGGDCSNYVSQVLHESGFKTVSGWNYTSDSASRSWCNAAGLEGYLIWSGKAYTIASGTYQKVYKKAYELAPGDVIAYVEKGKVVHMAFVTGADSKGYPLVNTHTTDRYHVPWDLGWNDDDIKFILLKVNYPS